jgi:hypothetical protein
MFITPLGKHTLHPQREFKIYYTMYNRIFLYLIYNNRSLLMHDTTI